eukprot:3976289-Pyramimonas_sp.AAC.1
MRDLDKSKEPVRCTRSLRLGILDVHDVGNTAFWTFVPLVYRTTHSEDAPGMLHFIVSVPRLTGV